MYLPYGVNQQGQLVYIQNVGRGRTTLICPYCARPLFARKGEQPNEVLSQGARQLLSSFSSDAAKQNFDARLELQHYRLGERPHPLIEFASGYPELRLQLTEYGQAYRDRFAHDYQEPYAGESPESL